MKNFVEIWKAYKRYVPYIDNNGFDHWWSLNWLERAEYTREGIWDGFICYEVKDNLKFSPKVAFGLNYITVSLFSIYELDSDKKIIVAEIYRVKELQEYFGDEWEKLLEEMKKSGVEYIYNKKQTKICFYLDP